MSASRDKASPNIAVMLGCSDIEETARAASTMPLLQKGPAHHRHGLTDYTPKRDWFAEGRAFAAREVLPFGMYWDDASMKVTVDNLIKLVLPWPGVGDTLAQLSQLPFTIASSSGLAGMFHGPSFSDGHRGHGLLAAFQGAGHQRIVSRRWLDHGPWATFHGPNDTTWVFFYDPDEPEADQLDRAKDGHRWMGISDEGGFLQSGYVYAGDLDVRYDTELQRIRQLVLGSAPEPVLLRDLCAARAFQGLGPDRPIQRVALVFMSETRARESLHDLWLREIECWALIQGREVRLDEGYEPPPKPAWARSLEQRYGTALWTPQ